MSEMVPDGWGYRPFGEFVHLIIERSDGQSDIPVLSVTKYDGFVSSLAYFKKQVFSKDISKYKKVTKGDFAYSTIHLDEGALGLLEGWDVGLISPMYTVFRTNELMDSKYLYFLMKSDEYMAKYPTLGQGSVNRRASIPFSSLATLHIHCPPLPEQHKIASILTSVDDVIEKTESQISKLQDLKKGMMQELLTKGIGHTEFKDSPVGRIPVGWGVGLLKNHASISYGISIPLDRSLKSGVRIIALPNVDKYGEWKLEDIPFVQRAKVKHKNYLVRGDILFNWRNGSIEHLAKTALFDLNGEYTHVGFLLNIRVRPTMNAWFLHAYLKHIKSNGFFLNSKIQVNNTYNKEELGNVPILIPDIEEQVGIADIYEVIGKKINATKAKHKELVNLKKALMQDLLTGKVRVTVN